jgi:membrane protease YdiL (CAAX protease family)
MDGNVLAGLAVCIVMQTVLGFVFGYVFHRTRNLVAPSLVHVASNVLGQMFG